jgi:di/tricarboxylate transporter
LEWQAWFALGTVVLTLLSLASNRVPPDVGLLAALILLYLTGVVSAERALLGLTNQGMLTVAFLFVVAAGVQSSGALRLLSGPLLGRPRGIRRAQLRLMLPVATVSSVVNNTPVVAMLLPVVRSWARNAQLSPSQLLIPLSYASLLGGVCSTLGTSTNLVAVGMLAAAGKPVPALFEIGKLGVLVAIAGIGFVVIFGHRLLPHREGTGDPFADPRAFTTELTVDVGGPYADKRLADIRFGDVPGLQPVAIYRAGLMIPAPDAQQRLRAGDRLVFAGPAPSVLELHRMQGLTVAEDRAFEVDEVAQGGALVELVVSERCPLVGRIVGDGSFRRTYGAAVLAVARHGERVGSDRGLGGWRLRAGDSLLVEADPSFADRHRYSADFLVATSLDHEAFVPRWQAPLAISILVAMVFFAATGLTDMFTAALVAAAAMVATRILRWRDARASLDGRVLLAIISAFGLGAALEDTGAVAAGAHWLVALGGDSPWLILLFIYITTVLFTEMVTNNTAAVLMVPIGLAAADTLGVNYMPFIIAIMMAASASFATPVGYQTNLMVFGPGGYRFTDFLRIGIPLTFLTGGITVALAPIIWPFH